MSFLEPRITLEDIASGDFIARADATWVEEMRATLAALTPETKVSESGSNEPSQTMRDVMQQHIDSARDDEKPMDERTAWGWAVADIVFGAFAVTD